MLRVLSLFLLPAVFAVPAAAQRPLPAEVDTVAVAPDSEIGPSVVVQGTTGD